jgi:hypothetical protein
MPTPERVRARDGQVPRRSADRKSSARPAADAMGWEGTIQPIPRAFPLDERHAFPKGEAVSLCRNRLIMLSQTWLAHHFEVVRAGDRHRVGRRLWRRSPLCRGLAGPSGVDADARAGSGAPGARQRR